MAFLPQRLNALDLSSSTPKPRALSPPCPRDCSGNSTPPSSQLEDADGLGVGVRCLLRAESPLITLLEILLLGSTSFRGNYLSDSAQEVLEPAFGKASSHGEFVNACFRRPIMKRYSQLQCLRMGSLLALIGPRLFLTTVPSMMQRK